MKTLRELNDRISKRQNQEELFTKKPLIYKRPHLSSTLGNLRRTEPQPYSATTTHIDATKRGNWYNWKLLDEPTFASPHNLVKIQPRKQTPQKHNRNASTRINGTQSCALSPTTLVASAPKSGNLVPCTTPHLPHPRTLPLKIWTSFLPVKTTPSYRTTTASSKLYFSTMKSPLQPQLKSTHPPTLHPHTHEPYTRACNSSWATSAVKPALFGSISLSVGSCEVSVSREAG